MSTTLQRIGGPLAALPLALTLLSGSALASSHREAPFITTAPKVDASDFYMFRSYEAGRSDFVTLIANYLPLQDAYGGPNYFALDPNALYEIHIDNNGDAKEDLSFQFRFRNTLSNGGAGTSLKIGDRSVGIPLVQSGQVSQVGDPNLQLAETYTVQVVRGDRRTGTRQALTQVGTGRRVKKRMAPRKCSSSERGWGTAGSLSMGAGRASAPGQAGSLQLFGHAGRFETCHLVEEARRGLDERPGQCGAGAFAEAQAEVDQRVGLQLCELCQVTRFGRAVAEDAVLSDRRCDARGGEQRRSDDEAVDEQCHAAFGGAEHGAGQDRKSVV